MPTMSFTGPYICHIKAVETTHSTKDARKYAFVIDFSEVSDSTDKKMVAIPSMHSYDSYEDAIQDAYGIVELYGFRLSEDIPRAQIDVVEWDEELAMYITTHTYFDGHDFYPHDVIGENE